MIGSVHLQLKSSRLGAGGGGRRALHNARASEPTHSTTAAGLPLVFGSRVDGEGRYRASPTSTSRSERQLLRNYFLSVSLIFKEGVVNISLSVYHDADVFVR